MAGGGTRNVAQASPRTGAAYFAGTNGLLGPRPNVPLFSYQRPSGLLSVNEAIQPKSNPPDAYDPSFWPTDPRGNPERRIWGADQGPLPAPPPGWAWSSEPVRRRVNDKSVSVYTLSKSKEN